MKIVAKEHKILCKTFNGTIVVYIGPVSEALTHKLLAGGLPACKQTQYVQAAQPTVSR